MVSTRSAAKHESPAAQRDTTRDGAVTSAAPWLDPVRELILKLILKTSPALNLRLRKLCGPFEAAATGLAHLVSVTVTVDFMTICVPVLTVTASVPFARQLLLLFSLVLICCNITGSNSINYTDSTHSTHSSHSTHSTHYRQRRQERAAPAAPRPARPAAAPAGRARAKLRLPKPALRGRGRDPDARSLSHLAAGGGAARGRARRRSRGRARLGAHHRLGAAAPGRALAPRRAGRLGPGSPAVETIRRGACLWR